MAAMPDLHDLIAHLSGIHVNDRDRRRVVNIAGHLIKSVLGDQWHQLSETQQELHLQSSAKRLWDNYMHNRKYLKQSSKKDAKQVIEEELTFLKEALTPGGRESE